MNPASRDICSILEGQSSLGLTFASNLFVGKEPAQPDNCVTVFDIPGMEPSLMIDGSSGNLFPSVQVRVRNNSYKDGWDLIHNIENILHGIHSEVWNGTEYLLIEATNNPFLLDWDDNNRARFVVDFNIYRKE